ncbi:MAG: Holliday junction branch migration DNA helicase RuvB, partial [Rhodobacterales bacterium CG_4_9_14_3_um_filter_71_31]
MTAADPLIRPEPQPEDARDRALRPESLDSFIGQEAAKANLRVFVGA